MATRLAPHEAIELHELLTFMNVCATKAATLAGLVNDDELRSMLQNEFSTSQVHIRELQNLVKTTDWNAVIQNGVPTGNKSH